MNILQKFYKTIPIIIGHSSLTNIIFFTDKKFLLSTLFFVKNHINLQYRLLTCISGVNIYDKNYKYQVVYELLSIKFNNRLRIKIPLEEFQMVPSSTFIFSCANWWEREVWDMYGIIFKNHPNLRRILTDYGFDGFPLLKSFPLVGYNELKYNFKTKKMNYTLVQLSHEYRNFSFKSPW